MLKRSQCSLTSIVRSSTQRQFNANKECLLVAARCSTTLSKFEVVSSRIPRYLKVCTSSIASPSNTNYWHGFTKLNTMTFVFFMFIVSPCSAQNCWSWSLSNCYYNPPLTPTSKRGHLQKATAIRACMLGPVHRILYCPSAPLGHPNIAQTIGG